MSEHSILGQLGSFSRGGGGTKADEVKVGVPCIRYGELYTRHDCVVREFGSFIHEKATHKYTRLFDGDIIFAASGETHDEIGKAAVFVGDEPAYAGGDTLIFRPNDGVEPLFLGYAVNSTTAARFKAKFGQGSSVIHISGSHLEDLPLFVPALAEQRRIAEILDTLDEAILTTEALVDKLEQLKKGLLHDLLTRGIDDNGELRDPDRHPEQFKDSPLGRLPREWEIATLGGCIDQGSGFAQTGPFGSQLHAHEYQDFGVPVVMPQDIRNGEIDDTSVARISVRRARDLRRHRLCPGDVIFARRGDLSKAAAITDREEGWLCGTGCLLVRPPERLSASWMADFYRHYLGQRQVLGMAVGSTMVNLNTSILRRLTIPVPSKAEQAAFTLRVRAITSRARVEERALSKLRRLKTGLRNDLLTGRVRVQTKEGAE